MKLVLLIIAFKKNPRIQKSYEILIELVDNISYQIKKKK